MELSKISTEVVSEKNIFACESTNFKYEVTTVTGNGNNQVSGTVKKTTDEAAPIVASFNAWGKQQFNVQFNAEMTLDEKIEVLTAFDEVVTKTQA